MEAVHAGKCEKDVPTSSPEHFQTAEAASAIFDNYLTEVRGKTYGASAREKGIRRDDIDSKGDTKKASPSSGYKNRPKIQRHRHEQSTTSPDSAISGTSDDSGEDSEAKQSRAKRERRKAEKKEKKARKESQKQARKEEKAAKKRDVSIKEVENTNPRIAKGLDQESPGDSFSD
ncbi:hypothetical protein BKA61DRAFT_112324 [Leptodontidium sp. MPI-SDFR-AT-0119]|nr:hypothetical protein BKA61DRAFT_112324 [Leptodontidium sp. MPI-SDFR-AT-0119]